MHLNELSAKQTVSALEVEATHQTTKATKLATPIIFGQRLKPRLSFRGEMSPHLSIAFVAKCGQRCA